MTIMYLTFGQNTEYHLQAYLSMLSFRRQLAPGADRIIVLTTAPEFYSRARDWVQVITIDDQQVAEWQGPHHFFWRAKIKAIEYVAGLYPQDHLLYLDCDTVLRGSISWLRQQLDNQHGLMDTDDGHPMHMKTKTLRMWHTVKLHTYGGITLGPQHHMYCAGVVGIPHQKLSETLSAALALCDGMLDDHAEPIVVEQYSLSIALYEKTGLVETRNCIAHYWAAKDEWMKAAAQLVARAHLSAATLDDELRLFDAVDWSALPVYLHKSNTARRLRHLVDKTFPNRDHRYIKGE